MWTWAPEGNAGAATRTATKLWNDSRARRIAGNPEVRRITPIQRVPDPSLAVAAKMALAERFGLLASLRPKEIQRLTADKWIC